MCIQHNNTNMCMHTTKQQHKPYTQHHTVEHTVNTHNNNSSIYNIINTYDAIVHILVYTCKQQNTTSTITYATSYSCTYVHMYYKHTTKKAEQNKNYNNIIRTYKQYGTQHLKTTPYTIYYILDYTIHYTLYTIHYTLYTIH